MLPLCLFGRFLIQTANNSDPVVAACCTTSEVFADQEACLHPRSIRPNQSDYGTGSIDGTRCRSRSSQFGAVPVPTPEWAQCKDSAQGSPPEPVKHGYCKCTHVSLSHYVKHALGRAGSQKSAPIRPTDDLALSRRHHSIRRHRLGTPRPQPHPRKFFESHPTIPVAILAPRSLIDPSIPEHGVKGSNPGPHPVPPGRSGGPSPLTTHQTLLLGHVWASIPTKHLSPTSWDPAAVRDN